MISGKTSFLGLIGNPVKHSVSPAMHNAALEEMGLDWCYIPLPCEVENLELVIKALKALNCKGINITIPHKNNVARICDQLSPLAKKLNTVNTLIPHQDKGWIGENTDVKGFLEPLRYKEWNKKKALIIGCGGSARAVLEALIQLQFEEIKIIGRNKTKLNKFVQERQRSQDELISLNIQAILQEDKELEEHIANSELIVNTTPIGMSTNTSEAKISNEMPLGVEIWENLKPKTTLYDLIYTPNPTSWLKLGRKKHCKTIDGLEMLIQQGAASLKLWSNQENIPIETMRKAAENELLN